MNNLRHTGYYDPHGRPVMKVFYTNTEDQRIPKKVNARPIYASGPNERDAQFMVDSKFISPNFWNAHGHEGKVIFDLGRERNVTGIRITLRSSAPYQTENPVKFTVRTSPYWHSIPDLMPWRLVGEHVERYQADMAPVYIPIQRSGRYFEIVGVNRASWLAFAEVEFYAQ